MTSLSLSQLSVRLADTPIGCQPLLQLPPPACTEGVLLCFVSLAGTAPTALVFAVTLNTVCPTGATHSPFGILYLVHS